MFTAFPHHDPLDRVFPRWLQTLRRAGYDLAKLSETDRHRVGLGLRAGRIILMEIG